MNLSPRRIHYTPGHVFEDYPSRYPIYPYKTKRNKQQICIVSPCRAVYSPVITVNQAHILSKSDQQVPERCLGSAVSLYHEARGNRIEQKPNPRRHQTARKRERERSEGRDYQSFPVSRGMMHDRTAHNARANETSRDVAPFFHIYPEINEGAGRACTRVSSSFRSSPRGPSATSARCPAAHYPVEADALPVPESGVVPLAGARHPTGPRTPGAGSLSGAFFGHPPPRHTAVLDVSDVSPLARWTNRPWSERQLASIQPVL